MANHVLVKKMKIIRTININLTEQYQSTTQLSWMNRQLRLRDRRIDGQRKDKSICLSVGREFCRNLAFRIV